MGTVGRTALAVTLAGIVGLAAGLPLPMAYPTAW